MHASRKEKVDKLLVLLLLISLVYIAYSVGYADYKYYSFSDGWWDMGIQLSSFYYHVAWPQTMQGLQYLSFSNHMDPFELLLLPAFALYPNPATLFLLQDLALVCAAIVIYYIGRNALKSAYVGIALAVAFLINPATTSLVFFDFHAEAFLPLFYLLAFYFYLRSRPVLFLSCYLLLLSVIETSVPIGITLLAGLLIYEYSRRSSEPMLKRQNVRLIAACALLTLLFFAFYSFSVSYLTASYATGAYSSMPPYQRVINFMQLQYQALASPPVVPGGASLYLIIVTVTIGAAALLLGFGGYSLRAPLVALVLLSPWLFEIFLLHNVGFSLLGSEYYSYVIGGAVVASAIGIERSGIKNRLAAIDKAFYIMFSAFLIAVIALTATPVFANAANVQNWLAPQNPTGAELAAATASLDPNSTILAQEYLAVHLYKFRNLELQPNFAITVFTSRGFSVINDTFYWFKPQYVLVDNATPGYAELDGSSGFDIYSYMGGNYTLYGTYGNVTVYTER